jgi:DNA (cytosine-5)-methyltransferase 1
MGVNMAGQRHENLHFLDLFAGAGGLSEGFIRAGFQPVAHIEMDKSACLTLKTRMAYHWLVSQSQEDIYIRYLNKEVSREKFYESIPSEVLNSVINFEIGDNTLGGIFASIDELACGKKINLIIGGPPCQAYSLVGRARDSNRMVGDKRNYLYRYYAKFLEKYKPEYFVFENVSGLLSAKDADGKLYFDAMKDDFSALGYTVEHELLSASNYGVRQNRNRIIIVGKKSKSDFPYPLPDVWNPKVKVREIFSDLPNLSAGEGTVSPCAMKAYKDQAYLYDAKIKDDVFPVTWHQARPNTEQDLEIYRIVVEVWNREERRLNYNELPENLKTHQNRRSFIDRFKVVAGDLPYSHTVVAHIARDGHYYIHPDIKQNRSLTPREAARLQTFPDNYFFESACETKSGRTAAFSQIGNAVPVLMAEKIAKKLREVW